MKSLPIEIKSQPTNISQTVYTLNSRQIRVTHSSSNCKLSLLEYTGSFLDFQKEDEKLKNYFDSILGQCRIAVYLNIITESTKNWILKNYQIYSCSKIPIGYAGKYQYHIIIRNPIGISNENMRETEFTGQVEQLAEDTRIKSSKRTKLVKFLRENKRKTDLVDKIIEIIEEE